MIISLFLCGLSYFAFAVSIKLFFALLIVNGSLGWFRSLADVSSTSILVSNTDPKELPYAHSARFMAVNLALVLGPLIGAVMVKNHSLLIFEIAGWIHLFVAFSLLFFGKHFFPNETRKPIENVLKKFHVLNQRQDLIECDVDQFFNVDGLFAA